jgi:ribonuclease BN (tRNA processing enzyme)
MLVEAPATRFLLDCGASSLIAMRRFGIDPAGIDAILVSHLHGDHFGGIPFFILDAQFVSRRTRPLVIAGPPGIEARVRQTMEDLFPGSSQTKQRFTYEFLELPQRQATGLAGLSVTAFEVPHAIGAASYALRVECDGKVLAYSGDTEWSEVLLDVADGADLFICESYYFEKAVPFHLSYRKLVERLPDFHCKRLILTHLGPEMHEHRSEVEIEVAEDGQSIAL